MPVFDVVAVKGREGCLIQCKTSSRVNARLGWDAIKEVVGATAIYGEQFPTVEFTRICLTNQRFNDRARLRAHANHVRLIEHDELGTLLERHPVGKLDVLAVLSSQPL